MLYFQNRSYPLGALTLFSPNSNVRHSTFHQLQRYIYVYFLLRGKNCFHDRRNFAFQPLFELFAGHISRLVWHLFNHSVSNRSVPMAWNQEFFIKDIAGYVTSDSENPSLCSSHRRQINVGQLWGDYCEHACGASMIYILDSRGLVNRITRNIALQVMKVPAKRRRKSPWTNRANTAPLKEARAGYMRPLRKTQAAKLGATGNFKVRW